MKTDFSKIDWSALDRAEATIREAKAKLARITADVERGQRVLDAVELLRTAIASARKGEA